MDSLLAPDMDARLTESIRRVPEHCREGLVNYLRYGWRPGGFLRAVLENDLAEACRQADETNRYALYDYIFVLYNDAPADAWGSPERVQGWIEDAALRRQEAAVSRG